MFQLAITDSWYNAYDMGFIGAELQSIFLHVLQPSSLSTYHGAKSTNNTMQYLYSLTQHNFMTGNAVAHQLNTMTPQTDNKIITPRRFSMEYTLPSKLWSSQLWTRYVSSNEPVKNGCEVIYEMFHILNCGFWNQVSYDHRSYERNLSNCVQKPEKVRTSTGEIYYHLYSAKCARKSKWSLTSSHWTMK